MIFFNLDLHISVIEDLKSIFEELGHEVVNWSISGHNWVFNKPSASVEIINQRTWRLLDRAMCDDFYNRYKDELKTYDAFIVTHTPAFSLLYEKFNKPIITVASTRYEAPFSDNCQKWTWLNNFLQKKIDEKIIVPVANNRYDSEYCRYFTSRDWQHIPSLCNYTHTSWNSQNDRFLFSSRLDIDLHSPLIDYKRRLGRFKWSDLTRYKGMIILPYNCSIMSIFEHYAANIPLFFPSYKFIIELYDSFKDYGVLSELTWNQVLGMRSGSILPTGMDDPNDFENLKVMKKWINLADFYDSQWMPHLIYFNSFEDLFNKLESTDLHEVSEKMRKFNCERENLIKHKWIRLLDNL